jgi:hypothetical protein
MAMPISYDKILSRGQHTLQTSYGAYKVAQNVPTKFKLNFSAMNDYDLKKLY